MMAGDDTSRGELFEVFLCTAPQLLLRCGLMLLVHLAVGPVAVFLLDEL